MDMTVRANEHLVAQHWPGIFEGTSRIFLGPEFFYLQNEAITATVSLSI